MVTVGDRMNNSRIIALLLAALGFTYIYYHFSTKGFSLDLNIVNAIFFFAGIALHGTMADYVQAVKDATPGVSGVIFQFPSMRASWAWSATPTGGRVLRGHRLHAR